MRSISLGTYDNPTTSKTTYDVIKEAFRAKEWNSFYLSRKKLDQLYLVDFPQIQMWIVLEASMDSTTMQQHCCLPHIDSQTCQWTFIPILKNTRLCHFYSYNVVQNEAHFMLRGLLYKSIGIMFQSQFEKVVVMSLKPFFSIRPSS